MATLGATSSSMTSASLTGTALCKMPLDPRGGTKGSPFSRTASGWSTSRRPFRILCQVEGSEAAQNGAPAASSAPLRSSPQFQSSSLASSSSSMSDNGSSSSSATPSTTSVPPSSRSSSPETSLEAILAFDGPGPETINGRLAMIGIVAGLWQEFSSNLSISGQLSDPDAYGLFYFIFSALFITVASIIPLKRGLTPEKLSSLFFTSDAERANGRVAMLGFAGFLLIESLLSLFS